MFDFFRDIALEMNGIDSEHAEREREKIKRKKKEENFIFSRRTKVIIFIFGILYLIIGAINITYIKEQENIIPYVLKIVFLSAVDISGLICLATGKRKAEVAALILIIVFMAVMYITTMIL